MMPLRPLSAATAFVLLGLSIPLDAAEKADSPRWSGRVQTALDATLPLKFPRGDRLPLYLWPAGNPGRLDDAAAEELVGLLDQRGVGLISSWSPSRQEDSLAQALVVARAQAKRGLSVNVNATACLHRFFNGDEGTAHVDAQGRPFWDESFNVHSKHFMGCPFALEHRKDPIRRQVESFAEAYRGAGLPVDFIFADWEIDGPIEFNRAHEASTKCERCRKKFQDIDNFLEFQQVLRTIRSELQRYAFTDPILARFPKALVGNYAVYPNNGFRYWYDYFETYVDGQPHLADRGAKYRHWANEFAGTGYTFAMPVVYTWYPTYNWYDFDDSDYRWFYNMLLVAGNAGRHTPAGTPIISFVHWHTTAPPKEADPSVKQMSPQAYQELLWHMLLRGTDTFFLWCPKDEDAEECRLVHEVYAAAQQYGDFLDNGVPVTFEVPKQPAAVVSGILLGDRVLVRRTDFGGSTGAVELRIGKNKLSIESQPGKCQVLSLP
ncbi:MAG: hypothetical protein GXY83_27170 [Rhodopirellula sp.]|nr:hypothetical protein [Rhodopirellula sp.]